MQGDETMTKDKFFSVESVRCVGACSLAPVADFDGTIEGLLTPDEITKKIDQTKEGCINADTERIGPGEGQEGF